MTAPPDRIWLQTSGDYEGAAAAMDEVTWCDQPMQDGDHEYVLRDSPTMQAAIAAARAEGREQGLREAAVIAETRHEKWHEQDGMAKDTCRRIAAAILALIPPSPLPMGVTNPRQAVPDTSTGD